MKIVCLKYQSLLNKGCLLGALGIVCAPFLMGVSYAADANPQPATAPVSADIGDTLFSAANSALQYTLPTIGETLPDWAKRVELGVTLQRNGTPLWSVLTVQPLYQSDDFEHTFFTQFSQLRYNYLNNTRDVSNVGLGYRKLFADNTVLVGLNGFYDYEWKRGHTRLGYGAEMKWSGLDITANRYDALSNKVTRGLNAGVTEEALSGYDAEGSFQFPYLPWLRANSKYYTWKTINNADDIKGWTVGAQADLTQNLSIEAGASDDNYSTRSAFLNMNFSMPAPGSRKAVAASEGFLSTEAWNMRDMKNYTLAKVRRQNKIILEQTGSGVVITRGN